MLHTISDRFKRHRLALLMLIVNFSILNARTLHSITRFPADPGYDYQSIRDTLCGTKAMWADDFRRLAAQRECFGDFDPFGDFDLLFGASRLGVIIKDVHVQHKERLCGSTKIS